MNSSESYSIHCQGCNQALTVTQEQVGAAFNCPSCNTEGVVPPPPASTAPHPSPPSPTPRLTTPTPGLTQTFAGQPPQQTQAATSFAPTAAGFGSSTPTASANELTASQQALTFLTQGKGWVRFHSVMLFIAVAGMLFALFAYLRIANSVSTYSNSNAIYLPVIIILISLALTVLQAVFLSKFASACSRLELTRNPLDLEKALVAQMNYWRLTGILVCISIIFMLIGLAS